MPRHSLDDQLIRQAWEAVRTGRDLNDSYVHVGFEQVTIGYGKAPVINISIDTEIVRGLATLQEFNDLVETEYAIAIVTQ